MENSAAIATPIRQVWQRVRYYWSLIKVMQTALLVMTGVAGFLTFKCPITNLATLTAVFLTLAGSISGTTILNMWYDRDIDALMNRTRKRPLAMQNMHHREALLVGLALVAVSVAAAFAMNRLYGAIIFAGVLFDFLVYTIWLKRHSCYSIIWGGLAGAMPILAGRALALGYIDWVGLMLALGIVLWIPIHILTYSMKYYDDYQAAGIPTFASVYGFATTRKIIAVSSVLASLTMIAAAWGIGTNWGFLRLMVTLSVILLALAAWMVFKPGEKINYGLFKYASFYMASSMVLMAI